MARAHRRQTPDASTVTTMITARVAAVLTGAAARAAPAGTSVSMSNMIGTTVTGISMITVPETTGVKTRRSSESRADSANWNRAEAATRVASRPGPPRASAVTQTAMNAPEVPISRM